MLTGEVTAVDVAPRLPIEPPRAVMWSVSAIATRDGVSKQAVSRKVGKLIDNGLTVERDAAGRVKAVNVVEYDRLRGRLDDPSKAQAPAKAIPAPTAPEADPESYGEAARQTKWLEAELKRLELDELKGDLVRKGKVDAALDGAAHQIVAICERLPSATDDLASASERGGVKALRLALQEIARQLRSEIAVALSAIAAGAPEQEAEEEGAAPALSQ